MSIRVKLALFMVAIMLLSILSMGIFTTLKSTSTIRGLTESAMAETTNDNNMIIQAMIENEAANVALMAEMKEIEELIAAMEEGDSEKAETIRENLNAKLQKINTAAGNLEHTFIVNENGIIIADSDVNLINADLSQREYTKQVLATGKATVSEILVSKSTGAYVIAFAHPVMINGQLKGFAATAVVAESIIKYLMEAKVLDTASSYAYLVDEKGNMIYHPTKEKIGQPVENAQIKQVVQQVQNGETVKSDSVEYEFKGKLKKASYSIIPERNWILVLTADMQDIMKPVRSMSNYIIFIGIINMVLALLVSLLISHRIASPIVKLTELINKTADLDLKQDESYLYLEKNKDETGKIAKAMMHTRKVLREMAGKLTDVSHMVMNNANSLEKLSITIQENAYENSATTQQLSAGMEETAASSEEITATVEEINSNVEIIADRAKEGTDISLQINDRALVLRGEAVESTETAKHIYNEVRAKMEKAIEQTNTISQISMLASTILGITDQTNLLALNAAIEAARAGEAGRGFAVVAGEIRKLAEESSKTAVGIQDIVKNIYASVAQMKDSSASILNFVDQNVLRDYDKLVALSEQYSKDATTVNNLMTGFDAAAEQLNMAVANISTAMNEVSSTVSEGAKGVQNIAEKTTDIVDKAVEGVKMSDANKKGATDLQMLIGKFKL